MILRTIFLLATSWLLIGATTLAKPPDDMPIRLAVTFDDLPWTGPLRRDDTSQDALERVAAVLRVHGTPATGFVAQGARNGRCAPGRPGETRSVTTPPRIVISITRRGRNGWQMSLPA